MRRITGRISNSGSWISLLHLSSSSCTEDSSRHADLSDNEPDGSGHEYQSTFATGGFPQGIRFVLVNNRIPRTDEHCALCGGLIEKGYVRDSQTRLIYCDTQCFAGWTHITTPVSKNRGRKAS
jgi:hypothetical protein